MLKFCLFYLNFLSVPYLNFLCFGTFCLFRLKAICFVSVLYLNGNRCKTDTKQIKTDAKQIKTDTKQTKTDTKQTKADAKQTRNRHKTDKNRHKTEENGIDIVQMKYR